MALFGLFKTKEEKITDISALAENDTVYRIGKIRFVKIILK